MLRSRMVDELTPGMPRFIAFVDCDAMVDEPSPNRALHFIDAADAYCQIVDPTGGAARFHDDEIALVCFEEGLKVVLAGGGVEKGMFTSF